MRIEILVLTSLVAFALGSMVVYGASAARGVRSEHTSGRGSFALGGWVREWFYWFLGPVERLLLALGFAPEVFNALGLLLGVGAGVAYGVGFLPAAGALLLAGGLADVFDGVVARARGTTSAFGAFLDSTLDRFSEVAAFVGLAAFYQSDLAILVVMLALSGSLLVSYTRARGESLGVLCNLGILQRAERMLLLGMGSILDPTLSNALGRERGFVLLLVLGLIAIGSLGTAVFRTIWISRELLRRG